MARKAKPRLRYYARFEGDFGYLRGVITNGKTRKYIITRIVVSREQLSKMESSGDMIMTTEADIKVGHRIKEFTEAVWAAITPLLESGKFDDTPSHKITNLIWGWLKASEAERRKRLEARAEAILQRKAAEAAAKGRKLIEMTFREFKQMAAELKAALTPEEYKALWEKGAEE